MTNEFPYTFNNARYMLFVDGEKMAIRYGCLLKKLNKPQRPEVECEKYFFVLLKGIDYQERRSIFPVRKYYYTALQGDQQRLGEIEEKLKGLEFEAPQVFKKDKQRGSKRVDIALATDMLLHAARKQMTQLFWSRETRILCAPRKSRPGRRRARRFVWQGISRALRMAADYYFNLDEIFF